MKHILKLSVLALIAAFLPSCDTYVQGSGHAHGSTRRPSNHHHSSGTNVNANVGASLGL